MIEFAPQCPDPLDYDEAFFYTLTLNYNGHKDWRLPTQYEYMTCGDIDVKSWDTLSIDIAKLKEYSIRRTTQPVRSK